MKASYSSSATAAAAAAAAAAGGARGGAAVLTASGIAPDARPPPLPVPELLAAAQSLGSCSLAYTGVGLARMRHAAATISLRRLVHIWSSAARLSAWRFSAVCASIESFRKKASFRHWGEYGEGRRAARVVAAGMGLRCRGELLDWVLKVWCRHSRQSRHQRGQVSEECSVDEEEGNGKGEGVGEGTESAREPLPFCVNLNPNSTAFACPLLPPSFPPSFPPYRWPNSRLYLSRL